MVSKNRSDLDSTYSLTSPRFTSSLKAAGTQVYLVVSSHDIFVGWVSQYRYAGVLKKAGIPLEVSVNYLSGHNVADSGMGVSNLSRVMTLMAQKSSQSLITQGKVSYYHNDYLRRSMVPMSGQAFTMEVPPIITPSGEGHVIMTGIPGTKVEFDGIFVYPGQTIVNNFPTQRATLDAEGISITKLITDAGSYEIKSVRILKPGQSTWKSLDLKQSSTDLNRGILNLEVRNFDPPAYTSAAAVAIDIWQSYAGTGGSEGTNGCNNVSYGIVEEN